MTRPAHEIGSARTARSLKRGDHVRLPDGRWAVVTDTGTPNQPLKSTPSPSRFRTVAVGLLVDAHRTEARTWGAGQQVWSRSPEEQIQAAEAMIVAFRNAARYAQAVRRAARAAGGAS
jgi:hypothetical protein